jgi:type I restriction enzyme S subunit
LFRAITDDVGRNSTLEVIAEIVMGQSPSGESYNESGNGVVFYQGRADFSYRFPSCRVSTTEPSRFAAKGDILMSVRAPVGDINIATERCCIGRGLAAVRHKQNFQSFMFYTMLELKSVLAEFKDDGTVFGSINKDDFYKLAVSVPDAPVVAEFEAKAAKLDTMIGLNEQEIVALRKNQALLLSELSSHR